MFNLLNNYNPRDFQDNLASPRFGTFFNSLAFAYTVREQHPAIIGHGWHFARGLLCGAKASLRKGAEIGQHPPDLA